jgi:hypothetical protein
MGWQDFAVLLVVAGAVVFLLRRFVMPSPGRPRPQSTFIPLGDVKRRDDRSH